MPDAIEIENGTSRRALLTSAVAAYAITFFSRWADAANTPEDKFDFLSTNGNSNCSKEFLDSIATMPVTARLQGSCCSEMDRHRYTEQTQGLLKHRNIPEIPPDPYDIAVGLSQKLLPLYDLVLTAEEQKAYDFAMENSAEKGPCCCRCWRWKVYGGLAKKLIRERGFTGEQIVEVWNLSDGCGGEM